MTEELKNELMELMADNLALLRAKLNLTQFELAEVVGISRYTLIAIEKKQRKMTWSTFLSLLLVFKSNENTIELLKIFDIVTDELEAFLSFKKKILIKNQR